MSNVSNDRNYTDNTQSGVGATSERAGDASGEPAVNAATTRDTELGIQHPKWQIYSRVYNFQQPRKM